MTNTKKASKAIVLLLSLLMTLSFISTVSASSVVDKDQKGSLIINKLFSDTGITEDEYNALDSTEQAKYVTASDGKYYLPAADAEYTLYKIATLEQTANGDVKVYYKDIKTGQEVDVKNLNVSDIDANNYTPLPKASTDASGYVKFSEMELGLYLVKETGLPDDVANANSFFVQVPMPVGSDSGGATNWEYNVVAYPKNSKTGMKITKEYVSGGVNDTEGNVTANLGDTINYKITANVPSDFKTTKDSVTTLNYTKFNIVDKASKYLTVNNSAISVKINGTTADSSYYTVTGPTLTKDTNDGKQYNYTTIEFTAAGLAALNNSDVITVEYSAKIAGKIDDQDKTNPITNTAYIEYVPKDGDPDDPKPVNPTDPDPTDPTKPITPEIYLYSYSIKKVDGEGEALEGAKFVLQKGDSYLTYDTTNGWGTTKDISKAFDVISGENGLVTFFGLAYGTDYKLVEKEAPKGFTLLKDPIDIIIDKVSTDKANASEFSKIVENHKNSLIILPETGGNGIYLFLIVGGALIATAIALYAVSRKKSNRAK